MRGEGRGEGGSGGGGGGGGGRGGDESTSEKKFRFPLVPEQRDRHVAKVPW